MFCARESNVSTRVRWYYEMCWTIPVLVGRTKHQLGNRILCLWSKKKKEKKSLSFDFRKRNLFLLSRNPLGTLNLRTACETYQLSLLVRVSGFRIGSDRIVIIVLLFVYYEKTRDHKRGGIFFFFLIIPDFVRFPRTLTISCFRFSENSWLLSFEIRLFVQKLFLSISATSPDLAHGSFLNIFSSSVTRLVSSDPWIVYTRNGFVRAAFSLSSVLLHHRIPDREELLWMRIETDDIDPLCRVRVRCARARAQIRRIYRRHDHRAMCIVKM